jgi:cyclopropane fatty-acyl-phospholipid synthase-like methyltransferase
MRTVIQATTLCPNSAVAHLRIFGYGCALQQPTKARLMSTATPLVDPTKFTTIAHRTHRYLSPLSEAKAESLIHRLALAPGQRVLDVGCGNASFLLDLLAAVQARGVGVDTNPEFIAAATAAARERGLSERAEFVNARLQDTVYSAERFDAVICMGSSQALGSLADAFAWAWTVLAPGGVALFADGYWKRPPEPQYLEALGATEDEMTTHAGNAARAREAGFRVLSTLTSNDDEWDEYEGRYCAAMERYIDAHPDDPDAGAMAARIRDWHEAYLRWGRDTLGFGFYALLKPTALSPG